MIGYHIGIGFYYRYNIGYRYIDCFRKMAVVPAP